MNKKAKIQAIRELSGTPKTITLRFAEAENGNDLIVLGTFTQEQIDLINAGEMKINEDLSRLSDEILRRMAEGYLPKIYYNGNFATNQHQKQ